MQARYDTKLLPEGVRATGYRVDGAVISVDAEMIRSEAFCPECGFRSATATPPRWQAGWKKPADPRWPHSPGASLPTWMR